MGEEVFLGFKKKEPESLCLQIEHCEFYLSEDGFGGPGLMKFKDVTPASDDERNAIWWELTKYISDVEVLQNLREKVQISNPQDLEMLLFIAQKRASGDCLTQ